MGLRLEIHRIDDWEALYVNGELHSQDDCDRLENFFFQHFNYHSNTPLEIDSFISVYYENCAIADYVSKEGGSFPQHLSDLTTIRLEAKKADLRQLESQLSEKSSEVRRLREEIEMAELNIRPKMPNS